jgi:hypothetical protein
MDWKLFMQRVNEDRLVARHGAGSSFNLLLRWGDEDHLLQVHDGRLAEHRQGPFVMPQCDFALAGSDDAWTRFTQSQPAPRDQDLFAFFRRGEIALVGDARKFFAHQLCLKLMLASLRAVGARP